MNGDPFNYDISEGDSDKKESPLSASNLRQDSDAYYALPDEDDDSRHSPWTEDLPDDSGCVGEEYGNVTEEADDEEEKNDRPNRPSLAGVLCRIMMSPVEGWKALRRGKFTPEEVASGCYYPCCGIAALSDFAGLIHDVNMHLTAVVISALGTFLSFFLSVYFAGLMMKILLPSSVKAFPDSSFGRQFVMMSLATMTLFHAMYEALPMIQPVLFFLPLWTAYIIVRGTRFVKSPVDRQSYTAGVLCFSIIGSPILIEWAFSLIS